MDLVFENVSKYYSVPLDPQDEVASKSGLLKKFLRPDRKKFYAVRDVNLAIDHGEAVGLIGHNGAGKSTMLKILSRITAPSEGTIRIKGRLAALLEVGSGFHPELTGRENIFLSASILGMKRAETARQLEEIIEFAEIRNFIDIPVKRYSSGMYVRLGFSIAAHLNPQILLLDEVLAVGDAAFQRKCLERVDQMRRSGITIVFISHDLNAVKELCTRAVLMHRGKIIADGSTSAVIREYQKKSELVMDQVIEQQRIQLGLPDGKLTTLKILNEAGEETTSLASGGETSVSISLDASQPIPNSMIVLNVCSMDARIQCQFSAGHVDQGIDIQTGRWRLDFHCQALPLQPGFYYIDLGWSQIGASQALDWKHNCMTIQVTAGITRPGAFFLPHSFQIEPIPAPRGI